jgi:hypothetical protein
MRTRTDQVSDLNLISEVQWWDAFENYLHLNQDKIRAECPQCTAASAQRREMA